MTNDRDFGERGTSPFSLLYGHEDMVKDSGLIAQGNSGAPGVYGTGPLVPSTSYQAPQPVFSNASAAEGVAVTAQNDSFIVLEDAPSAQIGNLLDDNGAGPDTAPAGKEVFVTAVNGIAFDGVATIGTSQGGLITVDADGNITADPAGGYEFLAEGEQIIETFTYTLTGTNVGFEPGTFEALIDVNTLTDETGRVIFGATPDDFFGVAIAGAGDVNQDGFADIIIGGYRGGSDFEGRAYIVFGGSQVDGALQVADGSFGFDGQGGFAFAGIQSQQLMGQAVGGGGDFNGDGISDFLIASPRFDTDGSNNAGSVDVIFGGQGNANVATSGFTIFGTGPNTYAGMTTANAGDVNNDGIDDILVGAWPADPGGRLEAGEIYLVYGREGEQANVTVSDLNGTNGFVVEGVAEGDRAGTALASAGDFNGDGVTDFIIGATHADPNGLDKAGSAYVIFGGDAAGASLNLSNADFRLDGAAEGDYLGRSVSSAGDLNGDGIDDISIGAYNVSNGEESGVGAVYVVFGAQGISGSLSAGALNGANGFVIYGSGIEGQAGVSVSSAGDVNADGIDDLLIGAHVEGDQNEGAAYVVFGREGGFGSELNLDELNGSNGFRIAGTPGESYLGWAVAGVGDMNGDQIDDIAVSAFGLGDFAGSTIIIYGRGIPLEGESTATVTVTFQGENDLPEGIDDNFSIAEDGTRVDLEETFLANDIDVDANDVLTVASVNGQDITGTDITVTTALGSTLVVFLDGTFDYIPAASLQTLNDGETAEDTFTYTATDGFAETTDVTVTLTITGITAGPDAVDDSFALFEDDGSLSNLFSGTVNVLDNDSTEQDASLFITAVNGVEGDVGQSVTLESGAIIILNADGSFDYQVAGDLQKLAAGEEFVETIEYFVSDGFAISAATISVTVTGSNSPNEAMDDSFSIGEDDSGLSGTVNVLDNDTDIDTSDVLTVSDLNSVGLGQEGVQSVDGQFGTATIFSDGTFEYVPGEAAQGLALGEMADDVFTYTVTDGSFTSSATITVTLTGENDAPEALDQFVGNGPSEFVFMAANASGGGIDLAFSSNGQDGNTGVFVFGLADIDGDGLPDSPISSSPLNTGYQSPYARAVDVGDIDGDGDDDVAMTDNAGIIVFTNVGDTDGDGDADFTASNLTLNTFSGNEVAMGDLNGDGLLDLVVHFGGQTTEFINLGDVNGNGLADDFSQRVIASNAYGSSSYNLEVADINGDGRADIVAPGWYNGPITIAYNLGDIDGDGFIDYDVIEIVDGTNEKSLGVDTADVDGDGDIDLVFARWSQGDEAIFLNDGDTDGDGRLNFTVIELPTGGDTLEVKIVDLDGDGDLDVVGSEFGGNVSLMLNQGDTNGDGVVDFDVHFTSGPVSSYGIAVQDSDGDGDIDIVVASVSSPSLLVNEGDTDGDGVPNFTLEALTGVPLGWDVENLDGEAGIFEDGPNAVRGYDAFDIDSDDDTSTLTYTILTQTAEGSVSDNGDGTFTFAPGADFQDLGRNDFRDVSFTYQATDQHGATSAVATVTISVQGTNDGPVGNDDTAFTFSEFPGMGITELNTGYHTFAQLGFQGGAVYGTFRFDDANGDGQITLTEVLEFEGYYSGDSMLGVPEFFLDLAGLTYFVYNLDGTLGDDATGNAEGIEWDSGTELFQSGAAFFGAPTGSNTIGQVTVGGATDQTVVTTQVFEAANVLANDTDIDATDLLSVASVEGQAANVGVTITLASGALFLLNADGSYSYDANGAYDGLAGGETATETITYTVSDGEAADEAQLVITVVGVNDEDGAVTDNFAVSGGLSVSDDVTINDNPDDSTVLGINGQLVGMGTTITLESGATVVINPDGTFTYTAPSSFTNLGTDETIHDSFSYRLDDGSMEAGNEAVETLAFYDAMYDTGEPYLYGDTGGDYVGEVLAGIGDINGDGIDDFAVASRFADNGLYDQAGKVYVIFGQLGQGPSSLNIETLDGTDGFVLQGTTDYQGLGSSIDKAGDVNGDGIDDFIIGSGGVGEGNASAQTAYIVYGRDSGMGASFAAVEDISSLNGTNGFAVTNENPFAGFGAVVSGAGDVNGDGFDDVIVSAQTDNGDGAAAFGYAQGRAYVILGTDQARAGTSSIQSEMTALRAIEISGLPAGYGFAQTVSDAGDVNGDGFADVAIGASKSSYYGATTYIVFGGASLPVGGEINASAVDGTDGFLVGSFANQYGFGYSIDGIGDFNGDGIDDVLIGAQGEINNFGSYAGTAFVIFGRDSTQGDTFDQRIDTFALDGTTGFSIVGDSNFSSLGGRVSGLGDVNGDGFNDIVVSTRYSSGNERSYVIFGSDEGFPGQFQAFAVNGVNGIAFELTDLGEPVGVGIGDINGDGFNDLAIGNGNGLAPETMAQYSAGVVYLLFGGEPAGGAELSASVNIAVTPNPGAGDAGAANGITNAADTFTGGSESDIVDGLMGNDTLNGMEGDDVLIGNGGNDLLIGGDGNDLLIGDSQSQTTSSSISAPEATGADKSPFVDPGMAAGGNPWVGFDASASKDPFVDPGIAGGSDPWVNFGAEKGDVPDYGPVSGYDPSLLPDFISNGFDAPAVSDPYAVGPAPDVAIFGARQPEMFEERQFVGVGFAEESVQSFLEEDSLILLSGHVQAVLLQAGDAKFFLGGDDRAYAAPELDVPSASPSEEIGPAKAGATDPADEAYSDPDPFIDFIG